MFCSKCGKEIPEGSNFCSSCGQPIGNNIIEEPVKVETLNDVPTNEAPVYAAPVYTAPVKKSSSKAAVITIICIAAVIIIGAIAVLARSILLNFGKGDLQKQLLRDWSRVEKSGGSSYYTLVLDFDEDEIEYSFDGTYVNDVISDYDYEIISKDTILVNGYKEIKIEFNDEKTMMTFTPALTSADSSENWFNFN